MVRHLFMCLGAWVRECVRVCGRADVCIAFHTVYARGVYVYGCGWTRVYAWGV